MFLPSEEEQFPVGRPRNGRRWRTGWRALWQAPSSRRQSLCFSALRRNQPDVRRLRSFCRQIIVVSHLERVIVFFDLLLVLRLIRRHVSDLSSIRPPRELLYAIRRVADLFGFAPAHRHNENLRLRVPSNSVVGGEGQPVPVRRPPG